MESARYRALCDEGLPPLAARLLSARDISHADEALPPLKILPPPDFLPDIERFCEILSSNIRNKEKICVVGDYDADGICATTLAVECLEHLGGDVMWRIPSRVRHGYGLHIDIVKEAAEQGATTLVTVDNGISAQAAIAYAKSLDMTVCVTDHHQVSGENLPVADCLVNPRLNESDTGKKLSGVGVAFYAMAALRRHLQIDLDMRVYLDLVAIGSVADCMPMDLINRALVGGGLKQLRRGMRPGLAALLSSSHAPITCRDISFMIAPCINAAGRFDSAEIAVECLLSKDKKTVWRQVSQLRELNQKRKTIVESIMRQATVNLSSPSAVVLFNEQWALGFVGIVAGRLADLYRCPAMVFTRQQDGRWRGSGRAPPQWDLYQIVSEVVTQLPADTCFGGHRQAVGVTVADIEKFKQAFIDYSQTMSPVEDVKWLVDELPSAQEVTQEAVEYLEKMLWGEEFPRPLFAGEFEVSEEQTFGDNHCRMKLEGCGLNLSAIAFNRQSLPSSCNIIFSLTQDRFSRLPIAVVEALL